MVEKKIHIHKLRRLKYKSGNTIFFCALPDCNFKTNVNLALGKRSICWRCEEPFIMNEYSIRLAKPHCDGCHKSKVEKVYENGVELKLTPQEQIADTIIRDNLSLADRLQQTIQQAKQTIEQEEEI